MDIVIITPARSSSRSGNDTTSMRWAQILRALGHSVRVTHDYGGAPADLMIALHAWRSAQSIRIFRALYPDRPLIVALSGTDIYSYIDRDPGPTLHSLACADRLLALHDLAERRVPAEHRWKVRVVYQSAQQLRLGRNRRVHPTSSRSSKRDQLDVAVIGHLREIKDPLRAAKAARLLPPSSRLRIVHLGAAETARWAAMARGEMRNNPRYIWRGDCPRSEVRALLARARAVVLSSLSEGGANVVSEAAVAGVPVLASHIDGSVGLLGDDYPGYFPVGDTKSLARLLHRIETDPQFLERLRRAIAHRAYRFQPALEKAAWRTLIAEILLQRGPPSPKPGILGPRINCH